MGEDSATGSVGSRKAAQYSPTYMSPTTKSDLTENVNSMKLRNLRCGIIAIFKQCSYFQYSLGLVCGAGAPAVPLSVFRSLGRLAACCQQEDGAQASRTGGVFSVPTLGWPSGLLGNDNSFIVFHATGQRNKSPRKRPWLCVTFQGFWISKSVGNQTWVLK